FDLWGKCQTCDRWKLLTKNNYGHSTLTVNDSLHRVHGMTSLKEFRGGNNPMAIFEMSETFGDMVASAFRKFSKDSPSSLLIEDEININENTNQITWQLMTTADVEIVEGGAVLKKEGQGLRIENISHPEISISVISLDPAPLRLDRQISGLKRIELRIPTWRTKNNMEKIKIRLSGL